MPSTGPYTVAGTGHRPDKLGGYGSQVFDRLTNFAYEQLLYFRPELVISGMALGWDQALALASARARIPFDAYIPFTGQELRWPLDSKNTYHDLLRRSRRTVVCSPGGYAVWKMQVRNCRMVDDCGELWALWDGSSGGTANCVEYAEKKLRKIRHLWSGWTQFV